MGLSVKYWGDGEMNGLESSYIARALGVIADQQPNLRDQFAMAALTGFLSSPEGCRQSMLCAGLLNDESMAHDAYKIADAMMEARVA